jgi:phosphohistidine phosphatase
MKARNIIPDLMITSSARRAMDTCSYLAGALGYSESDVIVEPALYHASSTEIFSVVRGVDDSIETLFIFGHNPGFTSFANALNNTDIYNIPTAGIVVSEINANSWSDVTPGSGTELLFDYPKKPKG